MPVEKSLSRGITLAGEYHQINSAWLDCHHADEHGISLLNTVWRLTLNTPNHLPSAGRPFRLVTVLDKMIIQELFKTLIAVLSVLVLIIVSRKFIKVLEEAIQGNIATETVAMLLGLRIIIASNAFLPAATFIAVLMVIGRMYREQEMAAIASAGGGVFTIYRAIFILVLPLGVCAAGLSLYVAPWAERETTSLMHEDKQHADIRGLSAGRFSEYSDGEVIFYTETVDEDGTMHNVFMQNRQSDTLGVVNAQSAQLANLAGGLYLILKQGDRAQGNPGQKDFTLEHFDEYAVLIEKKNTALRLSRAGYPTDDLVLDRAYDIAEFQSRINAPLGVVLLAFLGVPLARLSPRGGVYGNVLLAFGIYFAFSNLQRVNQSWVVSKLVAPWLGFSSVNGLLLLLGLILLVRLYGWDWIKIKLTGRITA
jgi:lipopolysaccharide export system permease protein